MKNLKNQPFACLMALLLSLVACNNSQKQLEEFSKEISNRCPIVINDAMSIVGANTDGNQLVYKMLLNEDLLDMGTIKSEEYKKLVAISVANQGLLSDNLIKVTIYDNTPILVAKSFTNFNFAGFILVNQRITIP